MPALRLSVSVTAGANEKSNWFTTAPKRQLFFLTRLNAFKKTGENSGCFSR